MAKNYTIAEAVAIINEGKDLEAITDIGRRYPILMHKVTAVCAKAGEAFVDFMSFMPDYLTANKVNTALKAAVGETESEDDGIEEPKKLEEATEDEAGKDYESMSAKQLWDILGKAGLRKTAKSTKKSDLVEACKAMDAAKAGGDSEDAGEDETEESGNPYDGKSAMELFKECKKRGIKAAPKKPAKFYADLLVKDDATKDSKSEDTESEDWDDEGEDEVKETKSAKKAAPKAKAEKKAAKKEEPKTESEDDDWDI